MMHGCERVAANKTEKEYGEEENVRNREVDANKILNFQVSANIFFSHISGMALWGWSSRLAQTQIS